MASVSAVLHLAVAALLSNFAAARPGEPFHPCNALDEQVPMPLMNSDFTDLLAHALLEYVKVAVAFTLSSILGAVCLALIGAFVYVIWPIFSSVFNEDQSPKETGHVVIPSMEMESAPAKVGYDGD